MVDHVGESCRREDSRRQLSRRESGCLLVNDKVFDSVLAGLSELVYICDAETYELLYLNESGGRVFGFGKEGGLCYQVLQGLDEPCPFCTNDKLCSDEFYEWEHTNGLTGQHYLLRDKLLEWGGRLVRLEVAFDVTERNREKESFRFLADAGAVSIECIKELDAHEGRPSALDQVLCRLGTFLMADRCYIFEIAGDSMSNTHEWCGSGIEPQISELQNMPVALIDHWMKWFEAGRAVLIDRVDDLPPDRSDEREVLALQGIRALAAAPVEIDGCLAGYLGVDNPAHGGLDTIETSLISLTYFVSASMKRVADKALLDELTWNDSLTHVHSRAAFHRDFDRGGFRHIGFVLVDADRLAVVNREQSRSAGDEILCGIATCLSEVFGDDVYRIGDDEFCAAVSPIGYAGFAELVEEAAQRFLSEGLHVSLGPAWHESCDNTVSLLDLAGDRMRQAKRGRHRAADLGVDLASDAAVSSLLRPGGAQDAAEKNMLCIYLMPQVSGKTGSIVGAEALVRYSDSERGMQALPSSFIPALEDMGEISAIDFFVLSKTCETIARWLQEGRRTVPLAVNFSRRTIGDHGFVERVADTVASYGIDRDLIEIEITESAREESDVQLRAVADGLRNLGFRVAVDDFGVENANFSLFTQLEFDVLKIDKSLVWGLGTEPRTMQVIRSLALLCSSLGIDTVAEGIETEEQYRALLEAGCTRAQGYLIGQPQPVSSFEQRFLTKA